MNQAQGNQNIQSFPDFSSWLETEKSLLAAMIMNSGAYIDVSDGLQVGDFTDSRNQLVYEAISGLEEAGKSIDTVTIIDFLASAGKLKQAGGKEYLAEILDAQALSSSIRSYATIIQRNTTRRKLRDAIDELQSISEMPGERSAYGIIDDAEAALSVLHSLKKGVQSGPQTVESAVAEYLRILQEMQDSGAEYPGLTTGFADLDKLTLGLQRGDMVVIAARPSVGKTAFALNIARNISTAQSKEPKRVLFFSLEMSATMLSQRLLTTESGVDGQKLRTGRGLEDIEQRNLADAVTKVSGMHFHIDDTPGIKLSKLRSRARRLHSQNPLDLIVVDYLGLVTIDERIENRTVEVSRISNGLKALARELNLPLLALSQVNRNASPRRSDLGQINTDGQSTVNFHALPKLADLRDSGAIEQDADVIIFLHRDEVFDINTSRKGIADVHLAKQRNGPTGAFEMRYISERFEFKSIAPDHWTP